MIAMRRARWIVPLAALSIGVVPALRSETLPERVARYAAPVLPSKSLAVSNVSVGISESPATPSSGTE